MIYGYIRVSTDKQTVENQRFEILEYAGQKQFCIDEWIEETISGTVAIQKRNLGKLISKVQKNDVIVCSELSRLGRNVFMIMSVLNSLLEHEVKIITVKEGYKLGDDISSKILAFAFGISAEIERQLLSQRTSEALKRKKAEGVILGRPKGKQNSKYKLSGMEDEIKFMIDSGKTKTYIAKVLGVSSATLYSFLKNHKEEVAQGLEQRESTSEANKVSERS